jgi:hypothetical protein
VPLLTSNIADTMLFHPIEHEKRSRDIADSTRRLLVGINAGGVAALLAVAGKLMDATPSISPRWVFWPLVYFLLSFAMTYCSMVLAKEREIDRRDQALKLGIKEGSARGEKVPLLRSSTFWDAFAALTSLFAIAGTLYSSYMQIP